MIALLRRARRVDRVAVVDQIRIPLVGLGAEEAVEALEAPAGRPVAPRRRRGSSRPPGTGATCRPCRCSSRARRGSPGSGRSRAGSRRWRWGTRGGLGDAGHAVARVVAPGQQARARRRAQRGRVPLRVAHARRRRSGRCSASGSARRSSPSPRTRRRRARCTRRSAPRPAPSAARTATSPGTESRMSTLILPLNGLLMMRSWSARGWSVARCPPCSRPRGAHHPVRVIADRARAAPWRPARGATAAPRRTPPGSTRRGRGRPRAWGCASGSIRPDRRMRSIRAGSTPLRNSRPPAACSGRRSRRARSRKVAPDRARAAQPQDDDGRVRCLGIGQLRLERARAGEEQAPVDVEQRDRPGLQRRRAPACSTKRPSVAAELDDPQVERLAVELQQQARARRRCPTAAATGSSRVATNVAMTAICEARAVRIDGRAPARCAAIRWRPRSAPRPAWASRPCRRRRRTRRG